MSTRPGMTSCNIEVGRGPGFKMMKALSLLSFLFVFTVILSGFNIRNSSAADCDCSVCHGVTVNYHGDGLSNPGNGWASCFTCHASPPATGSHSVHSAPLSNTTYGDTVTNTAGQYQFGCGHCHSMAVTLHRNDTKDVSLYGPSIGQSGVQACNDCHGSSAPSDHGAVCPSPPDLTVCSSCHTGHTTVHMATDGSGHPVPDSCASCHTQYAGGAHAGATPARDLSNSCGACHVTTGLSFISHSTVPMTAESGQCTICHITPNHTTHVVSTTNNCTTCHSATPRVRPSVTNCIGCHGSRNFAHDYEDIASTCSDCHGGGGYYPGFCADCHEDRSSGFHSNQGLSAFAAFSASTGSGVNAWTVTLNTFGSIGTISSVNWGDGTDTLTTHTYTSAGVKSITLSVLQNGQTASVTHSVTLSNYPISGTVKRGSAGLSDVTMTLTGTTSGTTVTNAGGAYSFSVRPGTYAVHAAKTGFTMSADVTSIVAAPGKTDANFTAQGQTQTAVLTVSKANSTYGSVSSSPAGISCDAACSGPSAATFAVGSVVRLTASASAGKAVSSLTCTGGTTATCSGTSCYSDVTIASGGNSCTAAFSDVPYVVKRVSGGVDSYYLNLADGLNAAVHGDVFYLKGIIFNEGVIYDKTGVTVTLEGGYDDSSFTLRSGTTSIGGSGRSLTIIGGTVIVDRIVIY